MAESVHLCRFLRWKSVSHGEGSETMDSVIDALNTGLSFGGAGGIRFGGLAVSPGRRIGQHWVIDADIGFAIWPVTDDRETA